VTFLEKGHTKNFYMVKNQKFFTLKILIELLKKFVGFRAKP